MKIQTRSRIDVWYSAAYREYLWRFASSKRPIYLVTEYPKSGGSWVCQMIADYLEIPYPRNIKPKNEKSVLHGHMLHHKSYDEAIVVLRDGRDVMVSAYYHYLFKNDRNSHALVDKFRSALRFDAYDDIRRNLPKFIEYMYTQRIHRFNNFTWSEFVDSWANRSMRMVMYEDLLSDTVGSMDKILSQLTGLKTNTNKLVTTVNRFSFLLPKQIARRVKRMLMRLSEKGLPGNGKKNLTGMLLNYLIITQGANLHWLDMNLIIAG